ncbi:MAG: hypothetical protein AAF685_10485 [Cyanobacteria bacterium P01_C01_bin.89]
MLAGQMLQLCRLNSAYKPQHSSFVVGYSLILTKLIFRYVAADAVGQVTALL